MKAKGLTIQDDSIEAGALREAVVISSRVVRRQQLAVMLLEIFGPQAFEDGSDSTARRVIDYWESMSVKDNDKLGFEFTTFKAVANQLIVVKDIEFTSVCAHHLLPFYGVAHVGYIPNRLMVGLSKIPRLVDHFAKRPQTQEVLASQIAHFLKERLEAHGVAVALEARHTCLSCRGVMKYEASMITSEMRGVFLTSGEARAEFLHYIGRSRL